MSLRILDTFLDLGLLRCRKNAVFDVESAHLRLDLSVILLNKRLALHVVGFLLVKGLLDRVDVVHLALLGVIVHSRLRLLLQAKCPA